MASSVATAPTPTPTTLFTSLPARPPTPPRETNHESESAVRPPPRSRPAPFDPRLSLQTPPNASSTWSPAGTNSGTGSGRARKKVEWSAHTEYKEPAEYTQNSKPNKSSPPSAPPSASSKPIKGILKPSSSHNPLASSLNGEVNGTASPTNIIEMLDSTIKQLAGTDRDSKLDAYMTLARALKASNNLPDRVALQDKMSLFMQFIQRDIISKNEKGLPDASLVNHALNLVTTFLHFPAIASTLTSDFGVFIMDHSIRSFEDPAIPKDIIRHLMQVVAFQNFSAKVMTSERVGRLVAALHKIESHLTGKSIIMSRIHIYRRLIKQSRSSMAMHSDWLQDMFTDMLSGVKEIRTQAISLGTEAGFSLRSEKPLIRRATDILQASNEGETYIAFYVKRLEEMIKDKQTSASVPQIWSVVILFLRCPLERWQYYGPWLTLVQSAFNMTDGLTKQEANFAWNRYVYLSLSDNKISPKALSTLCQPLSSQLRRKSSPKQVEEALKLKRTVLGGICNLYYYTFAPGSDKYSPDMLWDVAVQPIMSLLISLDDKPDIPGDCLMQAARMLAGLLDVSTPRVWRHDRIMDLPPVRMDELPPIDSKWIRKNCDKVFQVVGAILEKKFVDLANKESLVYRLWQVLVGSIASASAKDIKISEDTLKFIACTFSLVSKVWTVGVETSDTAALPKFFAAVKNLIGEMAQAQTLGVLPFTEKKLFMTDSNTFEPIATPSQRSDRPEESQGVARSPLHHLIHMLSTIPNGAVDGEAFSEFFLSAFEPFFKDRPKKVRLELARELLHVIPRKSPVSSGPWLLAAQNLRVLLDGTDVPTSSLSSSEQPLGPMYRELVSLLDRGLVSHPNLPHSQWLNFFELLSSHARTHVGDAGLALSVLEPIAKVLAESESLVADSVATPSVRMSLRASRALFSAARLPRDAHAVEAARRRLWGSSVTTAKSNMADPFDQLYKLGNVSMEALYEKLPNIGAEEDTALFLDAIQSFLDRTAAQSMKVVANLSSGICTWILDENERLSLGDDSVLSKSVRYLWNQACTNLSCHGSLKRSQFDEIEPLFTAAFKSKHNYIANKAAEAWNSVVKDDENVDCSDSLKSIVSSLRLAVDLALPGSQTADYGAQAGASGREDISFVALSSASPHPNGQHDSTAEPVSSGGPSLRRTSSRKRRMGSTPESSQPKPLKRSSTPRRLRHDNSQIQFAPIAPSSPLADESQHLTERQKEVRERQRGNSGLYSEMRDSSPVSTKEEDKKKHKQKTTPQRGESYNDLITSTPTPRRGQVLHLDDMNDPPSSPPLPRPYPLLSEIQSRSREASSMENWEFSSPPGSPAVGQQLAAEHEEEAEPQVLAEISQPSQTGMVTRSRRRGSLGNDETVDVIPSSLDTEDKIPDASPTNATGMERKRSKRLSRQDIITTPREQRSRTNSTAKEAPKPADNTPLAANSRSTRSSRKSDVSQVGENDKPIEVLVSRRGRRSLRGRSAQMDTTDQPDKSDIVESVTVAMEKQIQERPSPPVIPSTPASGDKGSEANEMRRKRKRGGSKSSRGRKRQSTGLHLSQSSQGTQPSQYSQAADEEQVADSQKQDLPTLPKLEQGAKQSSSVTETRKSARQRHEEPEELKAADVAAVTQRRSSSKRRSVPSHKSPREEGDTDEEIMSQLVTESYAASQSSVEPQAKEDDPVHEEEEPVQLGVPVEESKPSILDTLEQGLNQLRSATLSRDDVYKMEDMLMDMKRELFEAERRGRQSE